MTNLSIKGAGGADPITAAELALMVYGASAIPVRASIAPSAGANGAESNRHITIEQITTITDASAAAQASASVYQINNPQNPATITSQGIRYSQDTTHYDIAMTMELTAAKALELTLNDGTNQTKLSVDLSSLGGSGGGTTPPPTPTSPSFASFPHVPTLTAGQAITAIDLPEATGLGDTPTYAVRGLDNSGLTHTAGQAGTNDAGTITGAPTQAGDIHGTIDASGQVNGTNTTISLNFTLHVNASASHALQYGTNDSVALPNPALTTTETDQPYAISINIPSGEYFVAQFPVGYDPDDFVVLNPGNVDITATFSTNGQLLYTQNQNPFSVDLDITIRRA